MRIPFCRFASSSRTVQSALRTNLNRPRIIGRDSDFSVYLIYGLDAQLIAENTQSWSDKLPSGFNGNCEIAVHANLQSSLLPLGNLAEIGGVNKSNEQIF